MRVDARGGLTWLPQYSKFLHVPVASKDLDSFVTVQLLENTPSGQLCEDRGYSFEWTAGQQPLLIKNGRKRAIRKTTCRSLFQAGPLGLPVPVRILRRHLQRRTQIRGNSTQRPANKEVSVTVTRFGETWSEIQTKTKSDDDDQARGDFLRNLPEWLKFTDN